jgi:signal recognition particle receptor subunit beta
MITEVVVISPIPEEQLRLTYMDFPVDSDTIEDVLDEAYDAEPTTDMIEFTPAKILRITKDSPDGLKRKYGIALDETLAILVIGDEYEDDSSLRTRAGLILRELEQNNLHDEKFESLPEYIQRDIISSINEYMFQHTRLVLFGESGAGKSTIFNLTSAGTITTNHKPSVKVAMSPRLSAYKQVMEKTRLDQDAEWFQIANRLVMLYDLPGSERFQSTWKSYLSRADVAVLVVKSTKQGLINAKKILLQNQKDIEGTIIAIANFQDLPDALPPYTVTRFLGVETYGMVAIDSDMNTILHDMLKTAAVMAEYDTPLP